VGDTQLGTYLLGASPLRNFFASTMWRLSGFILTSLEILAPDEANQDTLERRKAFGEAEEAYALRM